MLARLGADEDGSERHAERSRNMQQPRIDPDNECGMREHARHLIERFERRHDRITERGRDLQAALTLGFFSPRQHDGKTTRLERLPKLDPALDRPFLLWPRRRV